MFLVRVSEQKGKTLDMVRRDRIKNPIKILVKVSIFKQKQFFNFIMLRWNI